MARLMAKLSHAYGWTDAEILARPLPRLRQAAAAYDEMQWVADVNARRLATVQLRTVCWFIAATVPTGKDEKNPLLEMVSCLNLGDGTADTGAAPPRPFDDDDEEGGFMPGQSIRLSDLPDAPPGVRVGALVPGGPVVGDMTRIPFAEERQ